MTREATCPFTGCRAVMGDGGTGSFLSSDHQDTVNSNVEHVCNSGTTLWNSGREEKEKRMVEHQ
jgi:hypothetical protein